MDDTSILNVGTSFAGGVLGLVGAAQQRKFEQQEAEKQRNWSMAQTASQNAYNFRMWQQTNEYNSPAAQVQRMREAGLNPLNYGLDGSSASPMEAAQSLGYDRASASAFTNPLQAGLQSALAVRSLQKDIDVKNAQIDKLKADTSGVELDNEFKDKVMDARVAAENLGNELTKEQISNAKKQREVMEQDVKKKIAETDNELEKKALIQAEVALKKASEKELIELLPYKKLLSEAQTEAQKAAASLSYLHALYQRKLIDSGYIDSLALDAFNRAELSGVQIGTAKIEQNTAQYRRDEAAAAAQISQFKSDIRNGNFIQSDSFPAQVVNGIFSVTSAISEALGGSLVPLAGGFMLGKGSKKSVTPSSVPEPSPLESSSGHPMYY